MSVQTISYITAFTKMKDTSVPVRKRKHEDMAFDNGV